MMKHAIHSPYGLGLALLLWMLCPICGNLSAAQTAGQDSAALMASLTPESARVGEIVLLTLDCRLPPGARLPEKAEIRGLEGLTVLTREQQTSQIKVGILVDRLLPWKSGPIGLSYIAADGHLQAMNAEPVALTVVSNLGEHPDAASLKALREILPQTKGPLYLLWVAVSACALAALAGLLLWLKKRRSVRTVQKREAPPHVVARKKIEQLVARRLFEAGNIKEFYFGFSEILRRYLAAIRHFPAAEFTTEEIAQTLTAESDRVLLPLLRRTDLIKFADDLPSVTRKDEDIRTALAYIETTTPAASVDSATGGLERSRP
ncbi:MAG: hypothetical protein GY697_20635 [Desulfobacterales bacterium]|nr:hypothetical protein [Desulfobacterales bacterium]